MQQTLQILENCIFLFNTTYLEFADFCTSFWIELNIQIKTENGL